MKPTLLIPNISLTSASQPAEQERDKKCHLVLRAIPPSPNQKNSVSISVWRLYAHFNRYVYTYASYLFIPVMHAYEKYTLCVRTAQANISISFSSWENSILPNADGKCQNCLGPCMHACSFVCLFVCLPGWLLISACVTLCLHTQLYSTHIRIFYSEMGAKQSSCIEFHECPDRDFWRSYLKRKINKNVECEEENSSLVG